MSTMTHEALFTGTLDGCPVGLHGSRESVEALERFIDAHLRREVNDDSHGENIYREMLLRVRQTLEEHGAHDIEDPNDSLELLLSKEWCSLKNPWYLAITDACVINHIGWDDKDAASSLANLIKWETEVALDPRVSGSAQSLIDQGRREVMVPYAINIGDVEIDLALDRVLRASGSRLSNYSMHKTIQDMRSAMREAMLAAPTSVATDGQGGG